MQFLNWWEAERNVGKYRGRKYWLIKEEMVWGWEGVEIFQGKWVGWLLQIITPMCGNYSKWGLLIRGRLLSYEIWQFRFRVRSTSALLVAQHIILLVLSWCPTLQVTEIQVTLCSVLRSGGWNNIVTFLLCSVGKWWILCLGDWVWSKNGETNSVASNLIDGQTNLLSWSK